PGEALPAPPGIALLIQARRVTEPPARALAPPTSGMTCACSWYSVDPPSDASTVCPAGSISSGGRRLSCRPIGHTVMSPAAQNVESGSPVWSMWLTPNSQPRLCGSSVGQSDKSCAFGTQPGVPGPPTVSPLISRRTAAAGASVPPSLIVTYRSVQLS